MREEGLRGRSFIPTIDKRILMEKLDKGFRKLSETDSTKLPLAHEEVPEPTIYVGGEPAYVVSRSVEARLREDAVEELREVARWVYGFVKSFFGPNKMLKLYYERGGMFFTISSLESLMRRVELKHPVAQLLIGAGLAIHREMGDGGVYTCLLASRLVERLAEISLNGVHQQVILETLATYLPRIKKLVEELSTSLPLNPAKLLELSVFNKLPAPLHREFLSLTEKVVGIIGVERVASTPIGDLLDIRYLADSSQAGSEVVGGVAFPKEIPHPGMPEMVEDARIAVLRGGLRLPDKLGRGLRVSYELGGSIGDGFRGKDALLKNLIDRILDAGANVLVVEKGIDSHVLEYLARRGVLALRRFSPPELDLLSKATGAKPFSIANKPSIEDLGSADRVYSRKIQGKKWIFFEKEGGAAGATILLKGFSTESLYDLENVLKQAVRLRALSEKWRRLTYGGGALEEDLYLRLSEEAYRLGDKRQAALLAVAEAFETFPAVLASNAGGDAEEVVLKLRSLHTSGGREMGVDAEKGDVADMREKGVLDPVEVKLAAIEAAFEAAYTILRVDGIIWGRKLSERELSYLKRIRGMEKRRLRKIRKDYGVETLE